MSKKGKAILASALFGAAIFGASCGGGGGGTSASTGGPPSGPPPASDIAKVLVLAAKGFTSPGATVGLYEGTVKSDGTIVWSSDLLPGENELDYYHEFSNKAVLLYDVNDYSAYLYTGGTLTQVTDGIYLEDDTQTPFTITSWVAFYSPYHIFLPNFVVMDYGQDLDRIITSNGKIVDLYDDYDERLVYAGRDYLVVGDGDTDEYVYIIKKDGTVTVLDWDDSDSDIDPISNGWARLLDRVQGTDIILLGHDSPTDPNALYVILSDGTPIRITNSSTGATGDDPVADIYSGKIMRDANGNIFVAVNYGTPTTNEILYFKVIPSGSGSYVYTPPTPIDLGDNAYNPGRRGGYALDGNGRLYVIDYDGTNFGIRSHFIDASNSYTAGPRYTSSSFDENHVMLAFANGVLVSNHPTSPDTFYHVLGTNAPTNVALSAQVIEAVSLCNRVNNTSELIIENNPPYTDTIQEPVVGEGTNRLMCASTNVPNRFAWVEASGTGTYNGRRVNDVNGPLTGDSYYLMATANSMIFFYDSQTFQECSFGASSCTTRNLTKEVFSYVYPNYTSNVKIKSDNNILSDGADMSYGGYWEGQAPNIRAVYFTNTPSAPYIANIQTGAVDSSTLNVVFQLNIARGGNVSLELDRVANVRSPISGAQCPIYTFDFVWYKDATNNFDSLSRPANTCLITVLQTRTP